MLQYFFTQLNCPCLGELAFILLFIVAEATGFCYIQLNISPVNPLLSAFSTIYPLLLATATVYPLLLARIVNSTLFVVLLANIISTIYPL